MTLVHSDRVATLAVPWLISVLLVPCFLSTTAAQVIDDFESGAFNFGGTIFDGGDQFPLPPIHCIASTRTVAMHINGDVSDAVLNLVAPDNEVVTVWGNGGGRLEFDYDPSATDLTFGSLYNAFRVHLTVAEPAGSIEIVLMDASGVQFPVSQAIGGEGDYVFPFVDFTGIDFLQVEFIELNLDVPTFGDYHISDFRVSDAGAAAAVVDVTQDTAEGPPFPTDALEMTLSYRDPSAAVIPVEVLEILLYEVTNGAAPPATQMIAMDSGGGVGMPGEQVAIAVTDLGPDPLGHRMFDLHLHAASVAPTMAVLTGLPAITVPPTPIMPTSFGLGFTTYQHGNGGEPLRRVKHWLSFETPEGSNLGFSNVSLMPGDPEAHPNSFHIFFDVDPGAGATHAKLTTPLFEMLLGGEVLDYFSTSGVSPRAGTGITLSNVPNPFNPGTEVRFSLPHTLPVRLVIHDLAGREVRVLTDGEIMSAGPNHVYWDGRDQAGRSAPSGGYLVKLAAGDEQSTQKITLLK